MSPSQASKNLHHNNHFASVDVDHAYEPNYKTHDLRNDSDKMYQT